MQVDVDWYMQAMREKIQSVDWAKARRDVARFISTNETPSLDLWSTTIFLDHLERLGDLARRQGQDGPAR